MNYELKSSINKKKISLSLKIVIIFSFIFILLHFIVPTLLSNILITIVKPIWNINRGNEPELINFIPETSNAIISELMKENIELKKMLNRVDSKNYTLAYILKKPPFTAYDSFILDIGRDKGIEVDNKVYTAGNILIGEIVEVLNTTSKVKLFSSYGTKYDVLIGEGEIQSTAIGRGGGSFEIIIPRDIKVNKGDKILIPNISNTVFGIVNEIIINPSRSFSTVIFSQSINIYEQKWVLVSKEKNND